MSLFWNHHRKQPVSWFGIKPKNQVGEGKYEWQKIQHDMFQFQIESVAWEACESDIFGSSVETSKTLFLNEESGPNLTHLEDHKTFREMSEPRQSTAL